jgi:hypothetical protein
MHKLIHSHAPKQSKHVFLHQISLSKPRFQVPRHAFPVTRTTTAWAGTITRRLAPQQRVRRAAVPAQIAGARQALVAWRESVLIAPYIDALRGPIPRDAEASLPDSAWLVRHVLQDSFGRRAKAQVQACAWTVLTEVLQRDKRTARAARRVITYAVRASIWWAAGALREARAIRVVCVSTVSICWDAGVRMQGYVWIVIRVTRGSTPKVAARQAQRVTAVRARQAPMQARPGSG